MAEPSTHINYSFDDVQRYLQGKMSAAEMHAIEKAALQDPFLADAIDGYREADANTAKQHLNEINAALFAEKKNNKVVAFNKRTQWLNIAALIIVLAGIGVVTAYFLRSSSLKEQTEIAKVQQPAKNESLQDSVAAMANSNALSKKEDTTLIIAQNKPVNKTQPLIPKRKEDEKIAQNKTIKQDKADTDKTEIASVLAAPPPLDINTTSSVTDTIEYIFKTNKLPVEEKQMIARSYTVADTPAQLQGKVSGLSVLPSPATFSGKVVDENNKPIAGVFIESADKKAIAVTDMSGFFNLQKTDTLLNATASTIGYDSRNIALKQGMNSPIVLKENNMALNEVVVTGYDITRRKSAYPDSIIRAQKTRIGDSAMPVGGWYNFNRYVISELGEDSTTKNNMSEEDLVELEFLVDKAGNPYNIKVIKPLDDRHNSKAIEILKNGPKWTTPSKKKKAKVVINF